MGYQKITEQIKEAKDLPALKKAVEASMDVSWPPKNYLKVCYTLGVLEGLIKEQELAINIGEPAIVAEAEANTEHGKELFLAVAPQ